MKSIFRTSLLIGAAAAALTAHQRAQAEGLPLNRFDPSPAGDRMFGVPSPTVAGEAVLRGALLFDYAHNPLVFYSTSRDASLGSVVQSQFFLHVNASLALWDRIGLNVVLPVALVQSGASPSVEGQAFSSPNKAELGDLRLGLRLRLFGEFDAPFQFAIGGYLWAPTGPSGQYMGDGKVRGLPQVLLGGVADRFVWSFALGPQFRKTQTFAGVTAGTQFQVGAGFGFLVDDARHLQIGAESYAAFTVDNNNASVNDTFARASNIDVLADIRYRFLDDWEIGAGAGPGIGSGLGTPDFRGVAMVAFSPESKRPPPDRDGDGIPDEVDACPDVKGVAHSDPKKHGCPPDRDGDGIPDSVDACPDVKGAAHSDPKKHGCPPDRDEDGIVDEKDACPDVKGAAHSDPKKHGCPPDRDEDGIVDEKDACPDVKGVAHSDPKKHGCPSDRDEDGIVDEKDACPDVKGVPDPDPKKNGCPLVEVTQQQIVIHEQVQFDLDRAVIKRVSDTLLDSVAAAFKQHTEILHVEVQGHTDSTGTPVYNRGLSQRRAEAVADALVKRGVAAGRVSPRGYGQDVPIGDNKTDEGRTQNRRVEFKILERAPAAAKPNDRGATP